MLESNPLKSKLLVGGLGVAYLPYSNPLEIDLGLRLQAPKGNHHFTDLAERVEYGNYVTIMINIIICVYINK